MSAKAEEKSAKVLSFAVQNDRKPPANPPFLDHLAS